MRHYYVTMVLRNKRLLRSVRCVTVCVCLLLAPWAWAEMDKELMALMETIKTKFPDQHGNQSSMTSADDSVHDGDGDHLPITWLGDAGLGAAIEGKESEKENESTQGCKLLKQTTKIGIL